jgi:hypothetical protein
MPAGNSPEAIVQRYGGVPPVAVKTVWKVPPAWAAGREAVVISNDDELTARFKVREVPFAVSVEESET